MIRYYFLAEKCKSSISDLAKKEVASCARQRFPVKEQVERQAKDMDPERDKDQLHCQFICYDLLASGRELSSSIRSPPNGCTSIPLIVFSLPYTSAFHQVLGDLNDLVPVDHEMLKQKIQESLPAHNASADLYMEIQDGEEILV
ncbi:hypothetical protein B9Z55_026008 [Caenorhabditis nigoni]|uniref:Uncharacterized protein n=1 Tax=Caenorhabditis nigoni TaxID=1611254 RepID=A0A2G5T161_9PELO|nr:hypothetical protein B9Z55_026008 [Caenorhabditis nigoni]